MLNNFYVGIKKFIKEYYKSFLIALVMYIILMFPVDYYIITGGGIMEVGDRIKVSDEYKSKGSFNLSYVSEIKGTISTYLLSYVMPDWKKIKVSDYTYDEEENVEDINVRGTIDLLNSNSYAIKNAYLMAKKEFDVKKIDLYVYYIDKDTTNEFKVGDKILKVNGVKVNGADSYRKELSKYNENDIIEIEVKRKNKTKKLNIKLYKKDNMIISGIYAEEVYSYKTNPEVEIKFKKSESGPSGGLIETLDIYNKLTKTDITNGKKIAGTGEIDSDGNILTIGEVKYKLLGAVSKKADIFIVPNGENYETCMKVKKDKNLKIKIIGVSTFSDAIKELKKIK